MRGCKWDVWFLGANPRVRDKDVCLAKESGENWIKITISVLQKVIMPSGCVHIDASPLSGMSMFISQPIHTIGFGLWKFILAKLISSTSRLKCICFHQSQCIPKLLCTLRYANSHLFLVLVQYFHWPPMDWIAVYEVEEGQKAKLR